MISRRALFAALAGLVAGPSVGQASIIDDAYVDMMFERLRPMPRPVINVEAMVASGLFDVPKRWLPIMDDFTVPDTGIAGYCEPHTLRKLQRVMCVPEAREEWLKVDREEYLRERRGGPA